MVGLQLGEFMVHVLEAGLTFLEANNPNNRPSVKGFNIINGQLAESSDGATFESRNPAILRDVLGAFPLSTKDDVNAALDAAHAAFPAWAATPAPTRGQIIGNMGRLLMDHKDDLVRLQAREIGKTLKECGGEIQEAIDKLRPILPLSFETIRLAFKIPGSGYGGAQRLLRNYHVKDGWLEDGSWACVVEIPAGMKGEIIGQIMKVSSQSEVKEL